MPEQPELRSLKEGETFNGFLLAQEVAFKTSAKGSEYLELKLADASGDLKAFLWDLRAIEGDMDQIAPDVFLRVKGQVSNYNGRTQIPRSATSRASSPPAGGPRRRCSRNWTSWWPGWAIPGSAGCWS